MNYLAQSGGIRRVHVFLLSIAFVLLLVLCVLSVLPSSSLMAAAGSETFAGTSDNVASASAAASNEVESTVAGGVGEVAPVGYRGPLALTDGATTLDRCPKCRWVCAPPRDCPKSCKPVCRAPTCRVKCKSLPPARCTTHCAPPRCRTVCAEGDRCEAGRCPKCVVRCDPPHCEVRCCRPKADCRVHCDPADCTWSCSAPRNCPPPKCKLECDDADDADEN